MSEPISTGEQPAKDTKFGPGNNANPKGRPKGSRNKLGEAFLKDLLADWETNGIAAIAEVRETKPDAYLKVVASILPKQAEITVNDYEHMDDGQLRAALSSAIRDLATFGVDIGLAGSEGGTQPSQVQPSKPLSPLH